MFLLVARALLLPGIGTAADPESVDDPTTRLSYSLGHQIGEDLKRQGTKVGPDTLERGVRDGFSGTTPGMEAQRMQQLLAGLKQKLAADEGAQKQ
ncbi:MAG TPA: FKBP-type peptidyl-prolyl cis-trans isomerase N-terminal domain-containing protein [Deferrisomatales bacterium]|nr:FKBP-type peptidyl-prolyl cis-trans isomerase N-terminal domain-containing protein [Deferrisomatales bacterium]